LGVSSDFSAFGKLTNIDLTSTTINEIKRIQFTDGSFDLNEDLANLLSINIGHFDELKKYLSKQGFNSFGKLKGFSSKRENNEFVFI
jgi:hypothetical protein